MGEKARLVAGFAATSLFVPALAGVPSDADLKLIFPNAKEIREISKTLTAEEIAQIEVSVGNKTGGSSPAWTLFQCEASAPDGGAVQPLRVIFLSLDHPKGASLAVATNPSGEVEASAVLVGGTLDKSWALFLDQFRGSWGLRLTSNSSFAPSHLAEQQKKAAVGGNEEAKRLQTLLTQKRLMGENQVLSELVFEQLRTRGEQAGAVTKDYAKTLAQLAEFGKKMSPLLEPAEWAVYQEYLSEMKKSGEALAGSAAKKDWDGAYRHLRSTQNQCSKCHAWEGTRFGKPLDAAMRGLREAMGIGNGYFIVGHDVRYSVPIKKEEAQSMAFAMKRALWILKFSAAAQKE